MAICLIVCRCLGSARGSFIFFATATFLYFYYANLNSNIEISTIHHFFPIFHNNFFTNLSPSFPASSSPCFSLLLKSILDAFKMWLVLLTPPLTDKSFLKIDCLPQSPQIKRQKTLLRNFIGLTIRFDWCDYQILLVWLKAQQIKCSSTMGL